MKNVIFLSTLILFSTIWLTAQTPYEETMNQAFGLWEDGKATEAIALFERIGQAETDNWIPLYHAAHFLIVTSFNEKDPDKQDATLDHARTLIKQANERSPNNSELTTLEGFLLTAFVATDPSTYGMMYSQKIMELHSKAIQLDPNNLRAQLNKIQFEMGSARFFGNDLAPFCEQVQQLIPKFEEEQPQIPFAPSHGIENAKAIVKQCDE